MITADVLNEKRTALAGELERLLEQQQQTFVKIEQHRGALAMLDLLSKEIQQQNDDAGGLGPQHDNT